jgi:hypothetical protein
MPKLVQLYSTITAGPAKLLGRRVRMDLTLAHVAVIVQAIPESALDHQGDAARNVLYHALLRSKDNEQQGQAPRISAGQRQANPPA